MRNAGAGPRLVLSQVSLGFRNRPDVISIAGHPCDVDFNCAGVGPFGQQAQGLVGRVPACPHLPAGRAFPGLAGAPGDGWARSAAEVVMESHWISFRGDWKSTLQPVQP